MLDSDKENLKLEAMKIIVGVGQEGGGGGGGRGCQLSHSETCTYVMYGEGV